MLQQITGPSLDMSENIDDLMAGGGEQRPGTAHSSSVQGGVGGGSGRSASSVGLHYGGQQHRVSVGSSYYYPSSSSRHGSEATAFTALSSARQSTCYSSQHDSAVRVGAGVVVTSHRQSQRRSSTSSASAAFAVATAGSSNPRDYNLPSTILGRSGVGLGLSVLGGGSCGSRASQTCSINLPTSEPRSSFGGSCAPSSQQSQATNIEGGPTNLRGRKVLF